MGNAVYEPEVYPNTVVQVELKYNIPIVGVTTRPIVKFEVDAPCQFKWIRHKDKNQILVGQNISYTPSESDVGCCLEFTCVLFCNKEGISKSIKTEATVGFPEMTISRKIINIPREVVQLGKIDYMGTTLFRITSYNIMAQSRVKDDTFPECPSHILQWVYRKRVLFSEIKLLDADISCLQEIPTKEVSEYWDIELSKLGFSSFIPDKNTKPGQLVNTLGIFFRRIKFGLVKQWTIDYDVTIPLLFKDIPIPNTNQFALVVLLEFKDFIKDAPNKMLVVNTQISKEMGHYQIQVLHRALADMVEKESPPEFKLPIVLCGSFGTDSQSEVYKYLSQCDLGVESMYLRALGKEPSYKLTNTKRVETSDFLFASKDFILTQVMDFDDKVYPNKSACSDHVPLFIELDVKK